MHSQRGSHDLPRYWITLGKDIIFDYPKDFPGNSDYPYITDVPDISQLIREYIDTPVDELLSKDFADDKWGLTDILRAADRRIGKRRLESLRDGITNPSAQTIIAKRLNQSE